MRDKEVLKNFTRLYEASSAEFNYLRDCFSEEGKYYFQIIFTESGGQSSGCSAAGGEGGGKDEGYPVFRRNESFKNQT